MWIFSKLKGFHSIVVLAAVDSRSKFIFAEVGANGRISDGGIWLRSPFQRLFNHPSNPLNVPAGHALVGDPAFALAPNFLVPYSSSNLTREQRIFNYRLSRLRFTAEDAFGQLQCKFRVLGTRLLWKLENAKTVTLACIILFNLLKSSEPQPTEPVPSLRNSGVTLVNLDIANRSQQSASSIRDGLCQYFIGRGALSFQENIFRVDRRM